MEGGGSDGGGDEGGGGGGGVVKVVLCKRSVFLVECRWFPRAKKCLKSTYGYLS